MNAEWERFGVTEWTAVVGERQFTVAAGSEVGTRYRANFDVVAADRRRPLVVVADGMGDGAGSAFASRTAVDVFLSTVAAGLTALMRGTCGMPSPKRSAGCGKGQRSCGS